ncbi:MAG: energy-coupling factor transporter transmembrane protein EcfT, partial [Atopobiaceae bacterium]|nr:energy-coupling factor transporter transmembrane protein EcfT [Atopobiaceae bacterium]
METTENTAFEPERHMAFDSSHPSVPATYLAGALLLTMFGLEPILIAISLAGALALSLCARGVRATRRTLVWLVPMALLITLVNPLFSASGATLVLQVGRLKVRAESLAFGACMGGLFCATVLWCESAVRVLTHDRLLALAGGAVPTVALMASMTSRLVPQVLTRFRDVTDARAAATVAGPSG